MKLDRFSKNTNIRLFKNPSSGSRLIPRGQIDWRTDRQTNNFANPPNNRLPLLGTELFSSVDHPRPSDSTDYDVAGLSAAMYIIFCKVSMSTYVKMQLIKVSYLLPDIFVCTSCK